MAGGVLTIDVARTGDRITGLWLTGPTNLVAKGEVFDEELPPSFSPLWITGPGGRVSPLLIIGFD